MNNKTLYTILLLLLMTFTFFVNNDAFIADGMESRNLTTAREMLDRGNWFDPTMNGEYRFEKPPLPTWAVAWTMHIAGQDNLQVLRVPAVLMGMLLIFFLFQLTKELTEDEKVPYLVAGIAATSFLIILTSRVITWDIFCHSFMLGAIWLFHKGLKLNTDNLKYFIGSGVLMGCSFLSKGPVAFFVLLLPYLIACIFTFPGKSFSKNIKPLLMMALLAIVISSAWPIYIYSKYPDVFQYVTDKESGAWINRHIKPFYYYWSFPIQSGIWVLLGIASLVFPYARKRIDEFGNYKFLSIWLWSAVLLMSLFPEKKARYLLPVMLPLTIITGFYFRYLIQAFKDLRNTKADTILFIANGLLVAGACLAAPFLIWHALGKNGFDPSLWFKVSSVCVFWIMAFVLVRFTFAKKPVAVWISMIGLMASICVFVIDSAPKMVISNRQFRPYEELRHVEELKNLPFFSNGDLTGKFIEVVWASGKEIHHWVPKNDAGLPVKPPLVFFSYDEPLNVLPKTIQDRYEISVLGLFDSNFRTGIYPMLKNYVSVIREKPQ